MNFEVSNVENTFGATRGSLDLMDRGFLEIYMYKKNTFGATLGSLGIDLMDHAFEVSNVKKITFGAIRGSL